MNELDIPTRVVELDINKIGKSCLIWTIGLSISLLLANGIVHRSFSIDLSWLGLALFIAGYIVLIALHEAFHLLGFVLFAKVPWRSLEFGINLKLGVAYATTGEPVRNNAMKKVLMLPFWTTGVLPALAGIAIDSPLLVLLGAWLMAGAAGDFAMVKELRSVKNNAWIKDDPELPKLYIFEQP